MIVTKLSFAEDFKEWTFGQLSQSVCVIVGLLAILISTNRTHFRHILEANWKTVAECLQKYYMSGCSLYSSRHALHVHPSSSGIMFCFVIV